MKNNMWKRFFCFFLAFTMCISLLPSNAMAAAVTPELQQEEEETVPSDTLDKGVTDDDDLDVDTDDDEDDVVDADKLDDADKLVDADKLDDADKLVDADIVPEEAYSEGNGNKGSYEASHRGRYASVSVSGSYKTNKDEPKLASAAPVAPADLTILDAWNVSFADKHTELTLSLKLDKLPELAEGESLAVYTVMNGALGSLFKAVSAVGTVVEAKLNLNGVTGLALVKVAAPEETPAPTVTPEETPAPTVTPEETPAPTVTPEETPAPTVTPEETPAPTVTPEETPAEEIIPLQENKTVASDNGVKLSVSGTLPENAVVVAEPVVSAPSKSVGLKKVPSRTASAAASADGSTLVAAYDITIYADKDHQAAKENWQPGETVTVSLYSEAFKDYDSLNVYHALQRGLQGL